MRVQPDTRFWIASTGKQFTSAAVLKCQEMGLVHLDDKLSRFFPAAPIDKQSITLLQLLSHTSGFNQSYASENKSDRAAAVQAMLSEPLVDRPGARFHYSNINYQLAVAIVEIASRMAYRDFVRKVLWAPNDLHDSGFAGDPGAHEIAPALNPTPDRLQKESWGGEGVYSTAPDLYRWTQALQSDRVLSAASLTQLWHPVAPISEGQSALGWFIGTNQRGDQYIFTRGNEDFGPNSLIYIYPKSSTEVVILTHAGNVGNGSWSRFALAKIEQVLSL
ncbi:MAG: beta-lactamase family protein [Candidatus Eremiobacteraeota bacterium]|nr:beta-lactamase family protein [Candidatus Eremiobacteraeota bacterium]